MKPGLSIFTLKEMWVACLYCFSTIALAAPADDVKALIEQGKAVKPMRLAKLHPTRYEPRYLIFTLVLQRSMQVCRVKVFWL